MTTPELVYVSFYLMLGDCDGSIQGTKVLRKDTWDREINLFKEHLKKIGQDNVQFDDYKTDMSGHVFLKNWKVYPCSEEELKVLKKFGIDTSSSEFISPSQVIDQNT